ncbi:Hypothetical predicted protein [Cloeon dipterum]|uniref:CUB domain-containing protein n=1 Tax=Cloeon dipterum TaxID=197152 RepID=A0A8S1D3W4_9INSE|nr:Hypothetical predicted protein [Cloeon dipterum]
MKAPWLIIIVLLGVYNGIALHDYGTADSTFCFNELVILSDEHDSAFYLTDAIIYDLWDNSTDFWCAFVVWSRDPLSVVFQNFNLRQNPFTKDCVDFIQFANHPEEYFTQRCGNSSAVTHRGNERAKNSPYLNFQGPALVYVELSIGKEFLTIRPQFKFSISFTAWKDCSQKDLPLSYASCGKTNTCIWAGAFRNGRVNCPFNGCLDEFFCTTTKDPSIWQVLFTFNVLDLPLLAFVGVHNGIASIEYIREDYPIFCLNDTKFLSHHALSSEFYLTDKNIYKLWDNSTDFLCSFEVHSKNPIAVVIENIDLREDPSTKECIDFIKFRTSLDENFTQFCGNLSAVTYGGNERAENSPYLNFKGPAMISVKLSIGKEALTVRSQFKFSISFTAWIDCGKEDLSLDYAPCGKTNMCIWKGLFCDGRVNCPFNGSLDETSCADLKDRVPKVSKPTIWEVLFTFNVLDLPLLAFVGLCVYLCRKYCCGKKPRTTSESAPPIEEPSAPQMCETEL